MVALYHLRIASATIPFPEIIRWYVRIIMIFDPDDAGSGLAHLRLLFSRGPNIPSAVETGGRRTLTIWGFIPPWVDWFFGGTAKKRPDVTTKNATAQRGSRSHWEFASPGMRRIGPSSESFPPARSTHPGTVGLIGA